MTDLTVDPDRRKFADTTGVYVRAKVGEGWDSVDIAELDLTSLNAWLCSRGGDNAWAEQVVRILLGHVP